MKMTAVYQCLCDETRLRILNLLAASPLCVCHLQQALGKAQVVISQHLAYLRERGMVDARRHRHWMIYSIPTPAPPALEINLKCLQDAVQTEPVFKRDRLRLNKLTGSKGVRELLAEGGCPLPAKAGFPKGRRTISTQPNP
jgi:ArsR family transcriptional regulator